MVQLSRTQMGIYTECMTNEKSTLYNLPFLENLPEDISEEKLKEAIDTVIAAHPALSARLLSDENGNICIQKGEDTKAEIIRLSDEEFAERRKNLVRHFDLNGGCLSRFEIYVTPGAKYFFVDFHHIIVDGTSHRIISDEIGKVYDGGTIEPEEYTFLDVASDDLKAVSNENEEFYENMLSDIEPDSVIIRDVYGAEPSQGWKEFEFSLDKEALTNIRSEYGFSTTAYFTSVMAFVAAKFNARDNAVISTIYNGRRAGITDRTVDMLVKTMPYVIRLSDDAQIGDVIARSAKELEFARTDETTSFMELAAKYGITSDLNFAYQGRILDYKMFTGHDGTIERIYDERHIENTKLIVELGDKGEGKYLLHIGYRKDYYSEELVRGIASSYIKAAKEMLLLKKVSEISLVDEEMSAILKDYNKTESPYDAGKTVVDLVREAADKYPDKDAVVFGDKHISYREFDDITDRIAAYVASKGIGREQFVGILIGRSENMPITSLGVMKAGAAYQPLDPTYPAERLNYMIKDSDAKLLIADRNLREILTEYEGEVLYTDEILKLPKANACSLAPKPEDAMIILYTSGTTGQPKGCILEHAQAAAFLNANKSIVEMDSESRVAAYASFGFDAGYWDMYGTLTSGATLFIIDEQIRLDMYAMDEFFCKNMITHGFMTTQVGRMFVGLTKCKTLRHFSVGGEKLVPTAPPEGIDFINVYGPSETMVYVTTYHVKNDSELQPIGKLNANTKAYVVDKFGNILPYGAAGELIIAGPQVGRCYLNKPEKTAETFIKNPYSDDPKYKRAYRTGDIVRFLPDGNLEFVGRRDGQVKVRGFRIELTEVERVIRDYPGVKDATVAAFDAAAGGKFVAAYIVSDEEIKTEDLNNFILETKPPYMVPAVTVFLDKIPINVNGKVDKRRLPVPEVKFDDAVPPQNETQQLILDKIAEVIGNSNFGINTDIFMAGLTSVGCIKVNVLLSQTFDVPVGTKDLKENSTVLKLEQFLANAEKSKEEFEIKADYGISKVMEGIFVESMANPDTTKYNIPLLLKIDGEIDLDKLRSAIVKAVDAHPYIKMRLFLTDDADIRQRRMDADTSFTEDSIEIITAGDISEVKDSLVKPFKLIGGKLFNISIIKAEANYLFIQMHHIISDGTSLSVFLEDITAAYFGQTLECEKYTGFEYAENEQKLRKTDYYKKAAQYYKDLLSGCDTDCTLSGDVTDSEGEKPGTLIYSSVYAKRPEIEKFCKEKGLGLNGFFTAAFGYTVAEFLGRDDVVFTGIYNGRNDSRLARSMAMLVRTLPIVCRAADRTNSVTSYIKGVSDELMESMSNDIYSFAEISREFSVSTDIMFAYQGDSFLMDSVCKKPAKLVNLDLGGTKAPINLNIFLVGDNVEYNCEYRADKYSTEYIEQFLDSLDCVCAEFIKKATLKDVSLLSEKAAAELEKFNDTKGEVPSLTAPELLEMQAEKNPDKIAVYCADEAYSFAQLNEKANRIANSLTGMGVTAENIIALYMDRCCDVYAIRQGIMKAGAAFVSVEPDYPDDRIAYILADSGAQRVITTRALYEARKPFFDTISTKAVFLEDLYANDNAANPGIHPAADNLAYCIYTSGSTGKPKGVMIEHGNLMNMLAYHDKNILAHDYVDNTTTFLALAAITFDVSIIEEMMPIYHGQSVAMATEEEIHNPMLLVDMMLKNKVDMMKCTPSYMLTMLDVPKISELFAQLRAIIVGAEPFPQALYGKIREAGFKGILFNSYGPTETTVTVTIAKLDGKTVTIGGPSGNNRIYMLSKTGMVLPKYAKGELVIVGKSVGRGYIGLDGMTAAKFTKFGDEKSYKSGDVAYWNKDGNIVHCGRSDNQVKIRGLRVELDEIENVMNKFPGIKRSVVLVKGEDNNKFLCGYYTADEEVKTDELTAFMGKTLTGYMIPGVFVFMPSFPMTTNGKVDKKALPEPKNTVTDRKGTEAATELEKTICEIFAAVLGLEKVYADEDFFELGGTSLLASKVVMKCMTQGITVVYADIFDNATPEKLAFHISGETATKAAPKEKEPAKQLSEDPDFADILKYNNAEYVNDIEEKDIGTVLLTGSTGFLGVHVLRELIETGHTVYCLVRGSHGQEPKNQLLSILMYYFGHSFEDYIGKQIITVQGDITDKNLSETLKQYEFDTVINCAACVKHFVNDDLLDRVNVHGVENLVNICKERDKKLIQISTVSIAGESVDGSVCETKLLSETDHFFGQALDNKYVDTKFRAETAVLAAVKEGMRGKIIRVGNLMSRDEDGEFQINNHTNGFMTRLKAYTIIGSFPVGSLDRPAEFSPIDCTAKAVVKLAGTPDKFTVFHAYNCHHVHMANIISMFENVDIKLDIVSDAEFEKQFKEMLANEEYNMMISPLISYMHNGNEDRRMIGSENSFTVKALYHLGFGWPITSERYIKNAIEALATLDFFKK